ncbi:MAG: DUF2075 domain-containing protein [Lachnospiraceae bacterium]|nr:DUF2075 domain-containing protein [Lachnospiraceae bacterium]MDD3616723.1 DUF2075 domain-containing protein [Lachnospiraceae bacterium]
MGKKIEPIVHKFDDNVEGLKKFQQELRENTTEKEQDIMLQFPTVYIHNWKDTDDYEVYIGESNNVIQRTKQHYDNCGDGDKWQSQLNKHNASLYVIGHEHFNKSLTLDIENRLMLYLMSVDRVRKIHNMRGNPQNKYYPASELDDIFRMMWGRLRKYDRELFPKESAIKDSAVFKASPLHKLTTDQEAIKDIIIERVMDVLESGENHQIIFIEGEAGTGKTVLNSSTFYELYSRAEEVRQNISGYLMVNHDEQITVYSQIAQKLGLTDKYGEVVCKPTSFINKHKPENPVDVAFIDEAHLLLTQGKQSYQGENQLQDIIDRARVTVVMFDENQILTTEQYWEAQVLDKFRKQAKQTDNYFQLKNQLRIQASKEIVDWIDRFTNEKELSTIPTNKGGYEIRIFDTPEELENALKKKAEDENHKLSRLIATYDWDYNNKKAMAKRVRKYWEVIIGKWHKPWNRELEQEMSAKEKRNIKSLSWAEQPQTIDEVGSTFTIQGFDLNYAGVILGPSVKYKDGKIVFDPSEKNYKKMIQNRTLADGTKKKFGAELTQHEVRILMTRGVEGLYIYACDDELRKALLKAGGK